MIAINFQQLIFFAFAGLLIGSALMTVFAQNAVRSALFLVLAFFTAAGLWILLQAEFLGLVLVLVYVGAVMTLFLFVVMTLNVDSESKQQKIWHYLPYALVIIGFFVGLIIYITQANHASLNISTSSVLETYSNTKALGDVLYTQHAYPFELAGALLLLAIIAAISLTFRGRRGRKGPNPEQQIRVCREDRIRIVKMSAEKKS